MNISELFTLLNNSNNMNNDGIQGNIINNLLASNPNMNLLFNIMNRQNNKPTNNESNNLATQKTIFKLSQK